jgi:hypothetical protein
MSEENLSQPQTSQQLQQQGWLKISEMPTSWKCEPIDITLEEIEEISKNAKVFIPYGAVGNTEMTDIKKIGSG